MLINTSSATTVLFVLCAVAIESSVSTGCDNPLEVTGRCTHEDCEPTCDHPEGKNQSLYPKIWENPICMCKKPYLRDIYTKECVLPEKCRKPEVSEECKKAHEIYSEDTDPDCEPTCANYRDEFVFCNRMLRGGCVCKYPNVRDRSSEECVHPRMCKVHNNVKDAIIFPE